MIQAVFYLKNGQYFGFSVSGHADYDDAGKDIVCSAVSALVINTVNSLETFTSDSVVTRSDDDGNVKLKIRGGISPESELLIKSLRLGLTSIYKEYGEDVIAVYFREVTS